MKRIDLIYRLEGARIEEGISVFELAPILLSIGQLIEISNEILYPGESRIAVNVKPFEKGSFIVDIALSSRESLQQILPNLEIADLKRIHELLEVLGLIAGAKIGVIPLVKWLRGKLMGVVETDAKQFRYKSDDNRAINVSREVHNLYQNCTIQNAIQGVIAKPLEQEGIEKVESYLKDQKPTTLNEVVKSDVEFFKTFPPIEMQSDGEKIIENQMILYVNPKRGSYGGEGGLFSFHKGGGKEIIQATIKDENFMRRLGKGEVRLFWKDLLKVRLIEKQIIRGQEITTTHEIVEVLDYKKAAEQNDLPLE